MSAFLPSLSLKKHLLSHDLLMLSGLTVEELGEQVDLVVEVFELIVELRQLPRRQLRLGPWCPRSDSGLKLCLACKKKVERLHVIVSDKDAVEVDFFFCVLFQGRPALH